MMIMDGATLPPALNVTGQSDGVSGARVPSTLPSYYRR
jgi:hypothetical protein